MKRILWIAAAAVLLTGVTTTPAMATPGPPDHPEWWFDTWNVPGLWAGGARGQGIVIGEIDTGINASLPELSANILSGTDFGSLGGNGQTDRDTDDFGHGTAMASLMVAHDGEDNILGIAPDAKILPIAVPITGTTDDAGDDAGDLLLKAIRWAADNGAKIITMSLGAARGPDDTGRSCPANEQEAIDYALSKGDIVVASGGNSGDSGSPVEEPSVCLGVVSVGAVDRSNTVPVWSSKHPYLTVTAPGVGVPSIGRIPGEAFFGDGTSQAAALTSGGLAVIWSKYPQLTGRQVVARLLATLDTKRTTRDPAGGYGVINIGSAVTASVPAEAPNPVFDAVDPFLAQDKAVAAVAPEPKVRQATIRPGFPGDFAVTPAPNPLTSGAGLAGIVGGSIGLIAMVLLIVGATRRRRLVPALAGGTPQPVGLSVFDPITEPIPMGPALAALTQSPVSTPESTSAEPFQKAQTPESDDTPEDAASAFGESSPPGEPDSSPSLESVGEEPTGIVEAPKGSPEPPAGPVDSRSALAGSLDSPRSSANTSASSVDMPGGVDSPRDSVDSRAGSVDTPGGSLDSRADLVDMPGDAASAPASSVDTPGDSASAPGTSVDTPGGMVDSPAGAVDTPGGSLDSRGDLVDSPDSRAGSVDTPEDSGDMPGGSVDTPGDSPDTPKRLAKAPGDSVDTPERSADTPGDSVDSPGDSADRSVT